MCLQIVECKALPILIQMLCSEDQGVHYEAVGVLGNLVHSSQHIKRKAGVLKLRSFYTTHSLVIPPEL